MSIPRFNFKTPDGLGYHRPPRQPRFIRIAQRSERATPEACLRRVAFVNRYGVWPMDHEDELGTPPSEYSYSVHRGRNGRRNEGYGWDGR